MIEGNPKGMKKHGTKTKKFFRINLKETKIGWPKQTKIKIKEPRAKGRTVLQIVICERINMVSHIKTLIFFSFLIINS